MLSRLTDLQKCQILLGNFYGDGNYQRNKKYKNATYIHNKHSNVQNDYVQFLEYMYLNMGIYQYSKYNVYNSGGFSNGNLSSYVAAKPPIIDFFENSDFIINGKKIITENGLNQLSILGLVLWYLDDGSLSIQKNNNGSKRHARLCTQCYSLEEHQIIQSVFQNKWNINVKIYGQTGNYTGKYYHYIYFGALEFKKFLDLIRPWIQFIPKSMIYKFDMKYEDLLSPYNFT